MIFGWVGQKVAILVWSSENVLIVGMARVRSGDFMCRSGFVSNPVDKTLICVDFLFSPKTYNIQKTEYIWRTKTQYRILYINGAIS